MFTNKIMKRAYEEFACSSHADEKYKSVGEIVSNRPLEGRKWLSMDDIHRFLSEEAASLDVNAKVWDGNSHRFIPACVAETANIRYVTNERLHGVCLWGDSDSKEVEVDGHVGGRHEHECGALLVYVGHRGGRCAPVVITPWHKIYKSGDEIVCRHKDGYGDYLEFCIIKE